MTHTFTEKDGLIKFTVKAEMLEKCPKPEEHDIESLVTNYQLSSYLHNPTGPAVEYTNKLPKEALEALAKNEAVVDGKTYWLNGELLSKETLEKFLHDLKFNVGIDQMLEEYKAEKKA